MAKHGIRDRRIMAAVGRAVQAHREGADLTRAQLAAAMGVTPATVRSWEIGRVSLGCDLLCQIAAACGVPVTAMFELIPEWNQPRRTDGREHHVAAP